ncbi:hypothetical protein VBG87_01375 [Streptococcus uberis]|uniref:hypothetical protein n=1 Tax=Streptococcus uberis TaxID=1349 RepID=UPI00379350BB
MTNLSPELVSLGTSLGELAIKSTISAITQKIKTVKTSKDISEVRKVYDEVVSELINERQEAIRIAQSYQSELEKVQISDEDIDHLHNTVNRIIEIISNAQTNSIDSNDKEALKLASEQISSYNQFKELINVDTLKTMQLLGFNYKEAIVEPLTLMMKNFILSKMILPDNNDIKDVLTPEMVEVLKNKVAYENFFKLIEKINN